MVVSGCSGRSSFLSGGPSVGQMKTSLAHLEFENAQMKRDLAKVRRENREIEDRLVQQEQDNGELAARLDDARNLLRDRGLDPAERSASARDGSRRPPKTVGASRRSPPPSRTGSVGSHRSPASPASSLPRTPTARKEAMRMASARRSP